MTHTKVTDTELRILLSIMQRREAAYGPSIREEYERRTGESISFGVLYSELERLEGKGLIESWLGEATAERGGKRKKFFRVNGAGEIAAQHAMRAVDQLRAGLCFPAEPADGVLT